MNLKKLLIENLRSYEKQEINFQKGSTLLAGDIGTGKTTILLAIEFALFGLQPGQKGNSLVRGSAENSRVILEFEIEGKKIVIERTLKKNKKTISQDYSSITIDNEKFEGSVTEVKNKILKILNYPPDFAKKTNILYKFTVYTPQEEMKQIVLEPGDIRLNTLRYVFGIDKYKRIEENSAILTSKLREKIRINEGIIFDLEEMKRELEERKNNLILLREKQINISVDYERAIELRKLKEENINEIQEKINEKKSFENEKSKSDLLLREKKQQITTMQNNIHSLNLQIQEAKAISFNEEEYKHVNENIEFQQKKEDELQNKYIQTASQISSQESKQKETLLLKNKISSLNKCPTCLQEVSSEYKNNIFSNADEEIKKIQKNLSDLNFLRKSLLSEVDSIKNTKEDLKKRKSELELLKIKLENIREKEARVQEIENQKSFLQKDLELLEMHIKALENSIQDFSVYDEIFREKTKELQEAKDNENSFAIKTAEINKEVQFLEIQINEKEVQIEKKEILKKKTERLKELEYWISEKFLEIILYTEKQVMITLKEEFSKLFSKWFSALVSETLTAKLDDDFSPVIEQQDYELDYSFLSGGERTAIALAYRLALNQVINSLLSHIKTKSLVILDEPTDGFSAQQLDKMRDVLNQLNVEQLIIVSHEQKIEGFVDNIIRLSKDNNVTKIEV